MVCPLITPIVAFYFAMNYLVWCVEQKHPSKGCCGWCGMFGWLGSAAFYCAMNDLAWCGSCVLGWVLCLKMGAVFQGGAVGGAGVCVGVVRSGAAVWMLGCTTVRLLR